MIEGLRRRTYAKVDLDSVIFNYNQVAKSTSSKICCVIKANAYGHGAVQLAKTYEKLGAYYFAVSNIEEALELRKNGITLPIMILGFTPTECAKILALNNISQAVFSLDYARELEQSAKEQNVKLNVHVKLDTGMGRIGFSLDKNSLNQIVEILSSDVFSSEGVFTHFAVADEGEKGKEFTDSQYKKFSDAVKYLEDNGVTFKLRHCSNSAGIFDYKDYHFDMVRAGIVLYGLAPSSNMINNVELKKVMQLTSLISHIKTIEKGTSLSYGRTFIAPKQMKVATVPIGYGDGFWRNNGYERYSLKVNGKYAKILGRVCMDQLMIDVSDIDCKINDEVLVFGQDELCSADEIARINGTINYEVVCAVGTRVPRIFVKDNKIVDIQDKIYIQGD